MLPSEQNGIFRKFRKLWKPGLKNFVCANAVTETLHSPHTRFKFRILWNGWVWRYLVREFDRSAQKQESSKGGCTTSLSFLCKPNSLLLQLRGRRCTCDHLLGISIMPCHVITVLTCYCINACWLAAIWYVSTHGTHSTSTTLQTSLLGLILWQVKKKIRIIDANHAI